MNIWRVVLTACFFLAGVSMVAAQCAPAKQLKARLSARYGEAGRMTWQTINGDFRMELWVSADKKTVTLLGIPAKNTNVACLFAAGVDLRAIAPVVKGDDL